MSAGQAAKALDVVAHKWRRLAERRREHFVELFYSGRWKLYYTEDEFLKCMREAIRLTERWALIAPPPPEEVKTADVVPIVIADHRDAA
jgi:uncharacterized repeat protein (TIGR03809 family)